MHLGETLLTRKEIKQAAIKQVATMSTTNYPVWSMFCFVCGVLTPIVTLCWFYSGRDVLFKLWRDWKHRKLADVLSVSINISMFLTGILSWVSVYEPCIAQLDPSLNRPPYDVYICRNWPITEPRYRAMALWGTFWLGITFFLGSVYILARWRSLRTFIPYQHHTWLFLRSTLPCVPLLSIILNFTNQLAKPIPNVEIIATLLLVIYPVLDLTLCLTIIISAYKAAVQLQNVGRQSTDPISADASLSLPDEPPSSMPDNSLKHSTSFTQQRSDSGARSSFRRFRGTFMSNRSTRARPLLASHKRARQLLRNTVIAISLMIVVEIVILVISLVNFGDPNMIGNLLTFAVFALAFHFGFLNYILQRYTKSVWSTTKRQAGSHDQARALAAGATAKTVPAHKGDISTQNSPSQVRTVVASHILENTSQTTKNPGHEGNSVDDLNATIVREEPELESPS